MYLLNFLIYNYMKHIVITNKGWFTHQICPDPGVFYQLWPAQMFHVNGLQISVEKNKCQKSVSFDEFFVSAKTISQLINYSIIKDKNIRWNHLGLWITALRVNFFLTIFYVFWHFKDKMTEKIIVKCSDVTCTLVLESYK